MSTRIPDKILIIRLSSIGDILLSIPLILELKSRKPELKLDFLIAKKYQPLLEPVKSNLHSIHCFDKSKQEQQEVKRIRSIIKKNKYDWVLDIHNSLRTKRILFPLNQTVYKINKFPIRRLLFVKLGLNIYPKIPVYQKYLNTPPVQLSKTNSWYLTDYNDIKVQNSLKENIPFLAEKNYNLIIFPGAKHRTKRWPLKKYLDLINQILKETNWNIIVSGDKDDKQLLGSQLEGLDRVKNVCGKHSLLETLNLIARSDGMISNDSGPMHIGALFHKPQIAIFGSTVQEFGFSPLNNKAKIIENNTVKCRPCSHIGYEECPQGHFKCMRSITVKDVFQASLKLKQMINSESQL